MKSSLTNAAVSKSVEVNPAYLFNYYPLDGGKYVPVAVTMASVLGTQSSFLNSTIEKASSGNPQRVEVAYLAQDCDTLSIKFTARFNGRKGLAIDMINLPDFEKHLGDLSEAYEKAGGYKFLGALYAANIASGKHAWRNGFGEEVKVIITARQPSLQVDRTFTFTPNGNSYLDARSPLNPVLDEDVKALGDMIGEGLAGNHILLIEVETLVKAGIGQEVFPSQEMVDNPSKFAPSRVYYQDPETHQAMMHSQKIGNAIRHIDIWHPEVDRFGAIAVEPFGSLVRRQSAVRYGNKRDFYTLLLNEEQAAAKGKDSTLGSALKAASSLDDLNKIEDVHYFFAVFMRGGVFGMAKKEDKKAAKKNSESEA